jgi:hypothetical protein
MPGDLARVGIRRKRQNALNSPSRRKCFGQKGAELRRLVGGRGVMRAQLAGLIEVESLPQVSVQVARFARGLVQDRLA